uniref:Uncharacterized protein n=1 Tax=Anguilla anguilla TaxID=7936 RepID=A0A0E9P5G5_ANGAN
MTAGTISKLANIKLCQNAKIETV